MRFLMVQATLTLTILTANAQNLVLSCDNGAAEVVKTTYPRSHSAHYDVQVDSPEVVEYFAQILSEESVLRDLDKRKYFYIPNSSERFYIRQDIFIGTADVIDLSYPGGLPEIRVSGMSKKIEAGQGVPESAVGTVQINPGVEIKRDGAGLKISFSRAAHEAHGIPYLYLGDWYFRDCQ